MYYVAGVDLGKMNINENIEIKEIFMNNIFYFLAAMFGFLSLGIANIIILLINGGMIGFFLAHGFKSHQFINVLLALAPHSIFEILSLLIASTYSYFILWFLYQKIFKKNKINIHFIKLTILTIIVIIILTFTGSIIEKYVSLV